MEILVSLLSAIGAALTAVFTYPVYQASRPLLRARVSDVNGANVRNSEGERLQQEGWYLLNVEIKAPQSVAIYPRALIVKDVEFGDRVVLPEVIEPGASHVDRLLIRPENREEGELEVKLRFGLLGRIHTRCRYRRTHWIGE